MARVSVVIPVYNGARTIARAIESALAQRFDGEFEVIVVDDGSTDTTPEVLGRYDGRITSIRRNNGGPAAARNAGVKASRGEYIAFLDADDAFMPEKLAATVPVLDSAPEAVLAFHDAIAVDSSGRRDSYVRREMAHAPTMADMLSQWWPILPSTAVIKRVTFDECGGFVEEFKLAAYEDPYLWILARERGEFRYIPQALAWYTIAPPAVRMEKYLHAQDLFVNRIRERYGVAASGLIRSTRRSYAAALGYEGLIAMRSGDMAAARRHFMRVLRHEPANVKIMLRLLRTLLPARIAIALSGRTGHSTPHSRPSDER